MKIRVISLEKSGLRHRWNSRKFEIFNAITLETYSQANFNCKLFSLLYGHLPSDGEIGCALSHNTLQKNFARSSDEFICILEDDAILEDKFFDVIEKIVETKVSTPRIYVLGFVKTRKKDKIIRWMKYPLKNKIGISGITFGVNGLSECGAISYILNNKAAKIIEEYNDIFWKADDWRIMKNMGIEVLYIESPVVYEDLSSGSGTGNIVHSTENIYKYPLKNIYMIIKSQALRLISK